MKDRNKFVFRSLALSSELNERLKRAAKLDDRSVSAIMRRGMMRELERIETEHRVLSSLGGGVSVREKSPPESQILLCCK